MLGSNWLSENSLFAHDEILRSGEQLNPERFNNNIHIISQDVLDNIVQKVYSVQHDMAFYESFCIFGNVLDDLRKNIANLIWMAVSQQNSIPTSIVCGEYVPMIFPFSSENFSYQSFNVVHLGSYKVEMDEWLENSNNQDIRYVNLENAINSMMDRLRDHLFKRINYFYKNILRNQALGTPYTTTPLLRIKINSPTKSARVLYTPIYCNSPQRTNGLTSPIYTDMGPAEYEFRVIKSKSGYDRTEPGSFDIKKSDTIDLTV